MLEQRTLLAVFAHPDDESFGTGGTLAKYAASGANVHVVIATDGDAGSIEAAYKRRADRTLAQERQEELARAAVQLGITTIWNLPYRDSGMRGSGDNGHERALIAQPVESLTQEIAGYMRRLRPQVVLTHDPFGGYGHPDHIRCCEATTAAFYLAGDERYTAEPPMPYAPQKLYYTSFDRRILKLAVRLMPLFKQDPTAVGRNKDVDLVAISRWETPIHARIDVRSFLAHKQRASQAHASQFSGDGGFLSAVPPFLRQRFFSTESFCRAYPAPSKEIESDLFASVRLA